MGFKGFTQKDFGKTISGTKWRASLGKELEEALSQELNAPFKWNESGRYNLIYLRHDWYIPYQHAAFQVSLGLEGMFAGLKIERGLQFSDNPMLIYHSGWDFWRFEQGLFSKNQQFLHALENAITEGLSLTICGDGDSNCKNYNITAATNRLFDWDPQHWCNIYIGRTLANKDAISLGGQVTNYCMEAFLGVARLYWMCVGN